MTLDCYTFAAIVSAATAFGVVTGLVAVVAVGSWVARRQAAPAAGPAAPEARP